jgi:adenine/guanine phosphoribosyltransferase-like PRPP-binding protein
VRATQTHTATVGSQTVELPIQPLDEHRAIALLITFDHGIRFVETAGRELAAEIRDLEPECIATAATLGIPVAIEVSRALGLDDYVVLHKSNKIHLSDAIEAPLRSITSVGRQRLRLDRARVPAVAGKRVVFVDDVISTGASAAAALRVLQEAGARCVGAAALMSEGESWRQPLETLTEHVRVLGELPMFGVEAGTGRWAPVTP